MNIHNCPTLEFFFDASLAFKNNEVVLEAYAEYEEEIEVEVFLGEETMFDDGGGCDSWEDVTLVTEDAYEVLREAQPQDRRKLSDFFALAA